MERIKSIDICKGILIWCVVLGHASFLSLEWLHTAIFWFHMPAFFIITGYLTNWEKYACIEFVKKRVRVYVIPYFGFSLFLIILYENRLKGILKMLLGGISIRRLIVTLSGLLQHCLYRYVFIDTCWNRLKRRECASLYVYAFGLLDI